MIYRASFLNLIDMKRFNKVEDYEVNKNIGYWRKKVTQNIFLLLSIFSIFAYVPSLSLSIFRKQFDMVVISSIIYVILLFLTFNKTISYKVKGYLIMLTTYFFGFYLIYRIGPASTGNLWLITGTVYGSILFGYKQAIVCNVLILTGYIVPIPWVLNGSMPWHISKELSMRVWVIHTFSTLLISTAISISISIFLAGFSKTLTNVFSTKKATIFALAKLAEHKDADTGEHILRLQKYTEIITEYLFNNHNRDGYLTRDYIEDIKVSSVLHDIGKVGIKDSILRKPGKLTTEEFEEMKRHTILGGEVISEMEKKISGRSVYSLGKEIAFYHHEKWNGTGYPYGLRGKDIPLSARIIAIVDVYDALTTQRPYKEAFSHEEALSIITQGSGEHFDPLMVEALIMNEIHFKNIAF